MGWAARSRVGYYERLQCQIRLEKLTTNLLPRLIWLQTMHLVVALACLPFRALRMLYRKRGTGMSTTPNALSK